MVRVALIIAVTASIISATGRAVASPAMASASPASLAPDSQIVIASRRHIWFFWNSIDGDQRPVREIRLPEPRDVWNGAQRYIAHDRSGNIFAFAQDRLSEFASNAEGDAPPVWTGNGYCYIFDFNSVSNFNNCGIAVDSAGEVFAIGGFSTVLVFFPPNTVPVRSFNDASMAPGGKDAGQIAGLSVSGNELYATDWVHNAILGYPTSSSGRVGPNLIVLNPANSVNIVHPTQIQTTDDGFVYILMSNGYIAQISQSNPWVIYGGGLYGVPGGVSAFAVGKHHIFALSNDGNIYVYWRDTTHFPNPVRVIHPIFEDPRYAGTPTAIMLYP